MKIKQIKMLPTILIAGLITVTTAYTGNAQASNAPTAIQSKTINKDNMTNMQHTDFTTTILVDQSPKEVFDAINNVRGWWSEEISGNTSKVGDEFILQYEDMHRCKIDIIESIPDKKIVWQVMENYFKFTKDSKEWTGNKMIFEITEQEGKTQLKFTQVGLVPEYECYDICSNAWVTYINGSLQSLISTGKGQPNAKGKPQTDAEKRLSTGH